MAIHPDATGHAVVIGGSLAGLVAARALADRFARVTIIERDDLFDDKAPRRGVPQAAHAHGLLASGLEGLERMFPGFTDAMVERGAVRGDIVGDSTWFGHGVELAREQSGLVGLLASRALIEAEVRRHLLMSPRVTLRHGLAVAGLHANAKGRRVIGVSVHRTGSAQGLIDLPADLVVDASGRGSRSGAWLKALGYDAADEEMIEVGISYTTRIFERRLHDNGGRIAAVVGGNAPHWRFGVALAIEHGRVIVTQGGYFGDAAPAMDRGFLDFARSLDSPCIAEVIDGAVPVSSFSTYRFGASLRRRYERLTRFPSGYLVFGDAVCSFNPVYGQGMSSAVLQAEALGRCLEKGGDGLATRFFKAAAHVVDTPWQIAAGSDLGHARLAGEASRMQRLMNAYIVRLYRAAASNPRLATEFLTVANLKARPTRLFAPSVLLAVARGCRRGPPPPVADASASTQAQLLAALSAGVPEEELRRRSRPSVLTDAGWPG